MFNPTSLLEQAQLRHQEMLKQAEKERLYRQIGGHRPRRLEQVMIHLRGAACKLSARPGFVAPVFDECQQGMTRAR